MSFEHKKAYKAGIGQGAAAHFFRVKRLVLPEPPYYNDTRAGARSAEQPGIIGGREAKCMGAGLWRPAGQEETR